jgi:hypothetical protein
MSSCKILKVDTTVIRINKTPCPQRFPSLVIDQTFRPSFRPIHPNGNLPNKEKKLFNSWYMGETLGGDCYWGCLLTEHFKIENILITLSKNSRK